MPKDNRSLEDILAENARLSQAITDSIAADREADAQGPSYALQSEFTPGPEFWTPPVVTEALIGSQQAEAPAWDGLAMDGLPAFILLAMFVAVCRCLMLTLRRNRK